MMEGAGAIGAEGAGRRFFGGGLRGRVGLFVWLCSTCSNAFELAPTANSSTRGATGDGSARWILFASRFFRGLKKSMSSSSSESESTSSSLRVKALLPVSDRGEIAPRTGDEGGIGSRLADVGAAEAIGKGSTSIAEAVASSKIDRGRLFELDGLVGDAGRCFLGEVRSNGSAFAADPRAGATSSFSSTSVPSCVASRRPCTVRAVPAELELGRGLTTRFGGSGC